MTDRDERPRVDPDAHLDGEPWPPRRHRPRQRPSWNRWIIAVGGFAAGALIAVLLWQLSPGFEDRTSGDGWNLVDKNASDGEPGSLAVRRRSAGVELRIVVSTDTGGFSSCPPPILRGVTRDGDAVGFDISWRQRGCGGSRNQELVVRLDDRPGEVWFRPDPDRCRRWRISPTLRLRDLGEQPISDGEQCGP